MIAKSPSKKRTTSGFVVGVRQGVGGGVDRSKETRSHSMRLGLTRNCRFGGVPENSSSTILAAALLCMMLGLRRTVPSTRGRRDEQAGGGFCPRVRFELEDRNTDVLTHHGATDAGEPRASNRHNCDSP